MWVSAKGQAASAESGDKKLPGIEGLSNSSSDSSSNDSYTQSPLHIKPGNISQPLISEPTSSADQQATKMSGVKGWVVKPPSRPESVAIYHDGRDNASPSFEQIRQEAVQKANLTANNSSSSPSIAHHPNATSLAQAPSSPGFLRASPKQQHQPQQQPPQQQQQQQHVASCKHSHPNILFFHPNTFFFLKYVLCFFANEYMS